MAVPAARVNVGVLLLLTVSAFTRAGRAQNQCDSAATVSCSQQPPAGGPAAGTSSGRADRAPAGRYEAQTRASRKAVTKPALPSREENSSSWYGWQTLAVDAAVLTVGAVAIAEEEFSVVAGAFGGYVLGGPIVHATHGRWGIAAASLPMRLVTPFVFLGLTVAPGEGEPVGSYEYRQTMIALGFAIPIVVDATLLAWDRPRRARRTAKQLSFHPYFSRDRTAIAVTGTF